MVNFVYLSVTTPTCCGIHIVNRLTKIRLRLKTERPNDQIPGGLNVPQRWLDRTRVSDLGDGPPLRLDTAPRRAHWRAARAAPRRVTGGEAMDGAQQVVETRVRLRCAQLGQRLQGTEARQISNCCNASSQRPAAAVSRHAGK